MDPEYEVIVLFISTTKWSIKVISIDRRTPPNTNTTVYIMQITSLPFKTVVAPKACVVLCAHSKYPLA